MNRIKQLDKQLINQIAAGEVIERPASVVKELVENSVDAGAKKVSVDITNECRDIRVADNGSGIHPDDIMLAFSKHATSKIENSEDLYALNSLGFRGEALSSIISIAGLTCITRTKDSDVGTKVECENSEVKKIQTGCAIGTVMEVKNLFYNIPARLKFLKNPKTEFSYIQEFMQFIAIAYPNVSFELKNNGKTALKTSGQGRLSQAVKEVYSQEVVDNLKEVLKTDKLANIKISGFVSTPDYTRSSKKTYHTYINSRTVKCPVFQKAVDTAYKHLISNGKYPFIVLNLEIPPEDLDVNVHPTKKEVRYKNTNQIFNFIYSAVDMALSNFVERPSAPPQFVKPIEIPKKEEDNDDFYVSDSDVKQFNMINPPPEPEVRQQTFTSKSYVSESPVQAEESIIGQYRNTYILIEHEDGLEIVDQHIADERWHYEKLKSQKDATSQLLFVSDVLTVSPSEAELIKENMDKFGKFGYGIDFLKENELIFRKLPQMISKVNPKEILADILENISGDIDGLEEKILITTSCKASIKANDRLTMWQMQELIKKWRTCEKPYTCPHGRPISKIIPHKEIAAFFERQH